MDVAHLHLDTKRKTANAYPCEYVTSHDGLMFQRLVLMTGTNGKPMYTHQLYYGYPIEMATPEVVPQPENVIAAEVSAPITEKDKRIAELEAQLAKAQSKHEKATALVGELVRHNRAVKAAHEQERQLHQKTREGIELHYSDMVHQIEIDKDVLKARITELESTSQTVNRYMIEPIFGWIA
jgi:hypothetical protein